MSSMLVGADPGSNEVLMQKGRELNLVVWVAQLRTLCRLVQAPALTSCWTSSNQRTARAKPWLCDRLGLHRKAMIEFINGVQLSVRKGIAETDRERVASLVKQASAVYEGSEVHATTKHDHDCTLSIQQ